MDDNFMKYWTFILCLLSASANSALISYEYGGSLVTRGGPSFEYGGEASVSFTVDTLQKTVVSAAGQYTFGQETRTFDQFNNGLVSEMQYSSGIWWLSVNASARNSAGEIIGLDIPYYIYGDENYNPLENLDQNGNWDWFIYTSDNFWPDFYIENLTIFSKTVIAQDATVPEPTTLALLSLGLAGFATRHRVTKNLKF